MLKVKLFYNYYKFIEKLSLLINYVPFTTKIFIIFKSLIENFAGRGEKVEGGVCQLRAQVLRIVASRVLPLALRLREGGPLFSGRGPLIIGGFVNNTTPVILTDTNNRNFTCPSTITRTACIL